MNELLLLLLGVLSVWLIAISVLVWKQHRLLQSLFPHQTDGDKGSPLLERFTDLLQQISEVEKKEQLLNKNVRELTLEGLQHLQKIALNRYNPYNDTGGNQSFTLVMLDGKDNGILLTSLHTRSGTRIYAKEVVGGNSSLELAEEEMSALKEALKK